MNEKIDLDAIEERWIEPRNMLIEDEIPHARQDTPFLLELIREWKEVLEFYADPWAKREHPDDGVPDFYSEMDFGAKANTALARLNGEKGE